MVECSTSTLHAAVKSIPKWTDYSFSFVIRYFSQIFSNLKRVFVWKLCQNIGEFTNNQQGYSTSQWSLQGYCTPPWAQFQYETLDASCKFRLAYDVLNMKVSIWSCGRKCYFPEMANSTTNLGLINAKHQLLWLWGNLYLGLLDRPFHVNPTLYVHISKIHTFT